MTNYKVTPKIECYMPPPVVTSAPLDYHWDEATNAVLFTSRFTANSFSDWCESLLEHLKSCLPITAAIKVEPQGELHCASFWVSLNGKDVDDPDLDMHCAWGQDYESAENLNSWIGSNLFTEIVAKDTAETSGLIREREKA